MAETTDPVLRRAYLLMAGEWLERVMRDVDQVERFMQSAGLEVSWVPRLTGQLQKTQSKVTDQLLGEIEQTMLIERAAENRERGKHVN